MTFFWKPMIASPVCGPNRPSSASSAVARPQAKAWRARWKAGCRPISAAAMRGRANIRELEQCVRNVLIDGAYRPQPPSAHIVRALGESLRDSGFTAEEILQCYCAAVQEQTGSYQETARRLGLDPRTVRTKVETWRRRQGK